MGRRLSQVVMLGFLLIHLLQSPHGLLHPPPVTGERSTTFEDAVDDMCRNAACHHIRKCTKIQVKQHYTYIQKLVLNSLPSMASSVVSLVAMAPATSACSLSLYKICVNTTNYVLLSCDKVNKLKAKQINIDQMLVSCWSTSTTLD